MAEINKAAINPDAYQGWLKAEVLDEINAMHDWWEEVDQATMFNGTTIAKKFSIKTRRIMMLMNEVKFDED